jgi:acetolactate synthase-1/2/3 large subunit
MPSMPVCLITGDGAFGFNLPELETARRENAPVMVVVNCDSRWSMELPSQLAEFPDRLIGLDHHPVRYDRVAAGLGCHGEYVDKPEQMAPALERASESGLPAVIHVAGDRDANVWPPGLATFSAIFSAEP